MTLPSLDVWLSPAFMFLIYWRWSMIHLCYVIYQINLDQVSIKKRNTVVTQDVLNLLFSHWNVGKDKPVSPVLVVLCGSWGWSQGKKTQNLPDYKLDCIHQFIAFPKKSRRKLCPIYKKKNTQTHRITILMFSHHILIFPIANILKV